MSFLAVRKSVQQLSVLPYHYQAAYLYQTLPLQCLLKRKRDDVRSYLGVSVKNRL